MVKLIQKSPLTEVASSNPDMTFFGQNLVWSLRQFFEEKILISVGEGDFGTFTRASAPKIREADLSRLSAGLALSKAPL